MQEKSRASLMTGETAVLTIAAAISRVRCWRRLRTTSRVIGSSPSATAHLDDEAPPGVDVRPVACQHEDGRVPPLHQRRAGERHARSQTLAVVERDRTAVLAAREPHGSHAPLRWRRIRRAERRRRERRAWEAGGGDHTAVDQVDRRRRRQRTRAVELGVARAKGVAEPAGVDEGHRHLPRLPPEAEVDLGLKLTRSAARPSAASAAPSSASSVAKQAASSAPSAGSGRKTVHAASRRTSAVAAPTAEKTAASAGTITRPSASARASGAPKSGPQPP